MDHTTLLDVPLDYERQRPASLFLLLRTLVGTGGAIGAGTNAVNGFVSPTYFLTNLGWNAVNVWLKAILQGLVEGLIYGLLMGAVFTIGFALMTRRRGTWALARRQIRRMVVIICVCWVLGGVTAILLPPSWIPELDHIYINIPQATGARTSYTWVWGSILGGIRGGVLAVLVGLIGVWRAR